VETAASTRRAGMTTFFRHQAITARTGAGILAAAASLDAHAEAPSLTADPGFDLDSIASSCCHTARLMMLFIRQRWWVC
jgi:hypothetical protein